MVGSNRVAQSAPDGYTFVLGTTGTHAQSQSLYKQPLYDVVKDFEPVALVAEVPIARVRRIHEAFRAIAVRPTRASAQACAAVR